MISLGEFDIILGPLIASAGIIGVALGFGATFFNAAQIELDEMARVGQGPAPRITSTRLGDRGPLIGAGAVGIRRMRRLSPSWPRRRCDGGATRPRRRWSG